MGQSSCSSTSTKKLHGSGPGLFIGGLTSSSGGELEDLAGLAVAVQVVAHDSGHVNTCRGQVLNHERSGVDVFRVGQRVGLDFLLAPGVILKSLVLDLEPGDRGQASSVPFEGEPVVLRALRVRVNGCRLGLA